MTVPLPDLFSRVTLAPGGVKINTLVGGNESGSPVLLLHGYPQTHVMWHHVAPILAQDHTVVLTDLRGYGDSGKPPGGPTHEAYAKRTMARDQALVMRELGFDEFAVVGHDRGARVAHRLTLDYPHLVTKLAVLDIVPTRHALRTADLKFGLGQWHWFFLAQPEPLPEHQIGADPVGWVRGRLGSRAARRPAVRRAGGQRVRPLLPAAGRDPRLVRGLPRRRRHRPGRRRRRRGPRPARHRPAARPLGRARLLRPPLRRPGRGLARVRRQRDRPLAALRPLPGRRGPARDRRRPPGLPRRLSEDLRETTRGTREPPRPSSCFFTASTAARTSSGGSARRPSGPKNFRSSSLASASSCRQHATGLAKPFPLLDHPQPVRRRVPEVVRPAVRHRPQLIP